MSIDPNAPLRAGGAARRAVFADLRHLVEEYLRLRDERMNPRSAAGGQLEAMELGLSGDDGDVSLWRRSQEAERKDERFAHLAFIWAVLTPTEQRVLEHRATPIGTESYRRIVRDSDLLERELSESQLSATGWATAPKRACRMCRRFKRGHRIDRDGEAPACPTCNDTGQLAVVRFTHASESFLHVPTMAEVEARPEPGPDNEAALLEWQERSSRLAHGFAVVQGSKPVFPKRRETAATLGLAQSAVRDLVTTANQKLLDRLAGRTHDSSAGAATAQEESTTMAKPGYLYGFKEIADVVSDVWDGTDISSSTAAKYAQRGTDPLPISSRSKGNKAVAVEADVRAWAARNIERPSAIAG